MHFSWEVLIFILLTGFLAAFVDSIAGGGGIISLPALILAGLPPSLALGTNKMASTIASTTSTIKFAHSGKISWKIVRYQASMTAIGAVLGVMSVSLISPLVLQPLIVCMLAFLTVYTIYKKDWHTREVKLAEDKNIFSNIWVLLFLAFVLGFYDGFFGPGAGSFLIFVFLLAGFDFILAAGNAKILNCISNIVSFIVFSHYGLVNYYYGGAMGIAMFFGALAGTHVAIKKGASCIRPIYIIMTLLIICKQLWGWLAR